MSKTTTERLFERYNTHNRRPTIQSPRHRKLIFSAFRRTLGPWLPTDKSSWILDIGCGEGSLLAFLRESGYTNLAGFDLSPQNVRICHDLGLTFVEQFDALRLREFGGTHRYDVIFAMDVLEHLPKESAAQFLEDARLRVASGGYLVIQTPNMGSIVGCYARYYDLSHEFGLTEKSALDLYTLAGYNPANIEIRPAWNATTPLGYLREAYLRILHRLIFLSEGSTRPRIPTKNLLVRAHVVEQEVNKRE